MVKVCLLFNDNRLKYILIKLLKEYNITFTESSFNKIPLDINTIFTDNIDLKNKLSSSNIKTILIDSQPSESLILNILPYIYNKTIFNQLVAGIDPGKNYGFIVIADGYTIFSGIFRNVGFLVKKIADLFSNIPSKDKLIRIGNGGGKYLTIFLSHLKNIPQNILGKMSIELVEESSCSNFISINTRSEDIISAYIIALNKGKRIELK
ncbi:MAG: hypothetical protein QXF82_01185 [Nitrososphaeria archaeon]